MESINRDVLVPYMEAYKRYLDLLKHGGNARPLSNAKEDYKRDIAKKAAQILNAESWTESEIGAGSIGNRVIKAVQAHVNLIGRFQVSEFSQKVKKDYAVAERILFDLYHDHKEQDCFEQICRYFGRKYDLVSYLYFILDPSSYLPLRSSIFDEIFAKLQINLRTSAKCSWNNYQKFLTMIAQVHDEMQDYYQTEDIDLLDAHSFLWTINLGVLDESKVTSYTEEDEITAAEKKVEVGAAVYHKEYGKGIINEISEERIYVTFGSRYRIFPYPKAFDREYLKL